MSGDHGEWSWYWRLLPLIATGVALTGCSGANDDLPRLPLSGRVFVDGKPLAHGSISLYPEEISTKEHELVPSGGLVVKGWFSIPREKGPVAGKYKIAVTSDKRVVQSSRRDRQDMPAEAQPAAAETIPARFNTKTELEFELPEGGIKELRVDLQSS